MAARKPKVEYYWSLRGNVGANLVTAYAVVNWRLVAANGEIMCQSTQGFQDKTDARRSVRAVMSLLGAEPLVSVNMVIREVGPGRKPG